MEIKAFIINIEKIQGSMAITALFCEKNGKEVKYTTQIAHEEEVVRAITSGKVVLDNAIVEKGKLKGKTGSLERFNRESKPLVIIKELVKDSGEALGYRVCTSEGTVKNIRIKDVLAYAKRKTDAGLIPFQNGIYVQETNVRKDHIKSFSPDGFDKEIMSVTKNNHAVTPSVDTKSNEKSISRLDKTFTKEQQIELKKGIKSGVDIKVYGNPKLTTEKMRILREGLENRLPVHLIASPDFTEDAMETYASDLKYGFDIRPYLSPKYTPSQITELALGVEDGLDISVYADPKNTVETMEEIRLRLFHGIWKEELAGKDGKWI